MNIGINKNYRIIDNKVVSQLIIFGMIVCSITGCGKKEELLTPSSQDFSKEIQQLNSQVIDLKERVSFLENKLHLKDEIQFEKEQKAKGLVQYQGRWITNEEKERLIEEERKRQEQYKRLNLPKPKGKGLVFYNGRWVTPEEKLKMENQKMSQEQND